VCKSFYTVVFTAVLLVVALSLASTVAAQEESTSEETSMMAADAANRQVDAETDNVSVEVGNGKVSAKTDNVSTSNETSSQQSSVTVQQNQADEGSGSEANTGDVNIAQNSSSSCKNPSRLDSIDDATRDASFSFNTTGNKFRVTYDVTFDTDGDSFRIEINRNGTEVESDETTEDVTDRDFIVSAGSDTYELRADVTPDDTATYSVTVDDCRGSDDNNDGNNRNNNRNNRNNDNNRNNRIIRIDRNNDDNNGGAARQQYGDTEVIVKTIPDKGRLADTGGLPLAGVALVALASVGLGLSILRSATRRDP
jgi:hypothetical protein